MPLPSVPKVLPLTVLGLKRWLDQMDPDSLVVMASDEEGNGFATIDSEMGLGFEMFKGKRVVVLWPSWQQVDLDE